MAPTPLDYSKKTILKLVLRFQLFLLGVERRKKKIFI